MTINESDIYEMVRGIYYSNIEEGIHWEPFEYYENEQVESFVESDVYYWKGFLKSKGIKIREED